MQITEFKIKVQLKQENYDEDKIKIYYDEDGTEIIDEDEDVYINEIEIDLAEIEEIYEDYNYSLDELKEEYPHYESIIENIYSHNSLTDFINYIAENINYNSDDLDENSYEFISGELQCGRQWYTILCDVKEYSFDDLISFFDSVRVFNDTEWDEDKFNAIMEYYEVYTDRADISDIMGRISDCEDDSFTLVDDIADYACEYIHGSYNFPDYYDNYIDYEEYGKDNFDATETNYGWVIIY